MPQMRSGKYSIAWFKLAEFVVRKEKERALGIYRLLAHSLPDEAVASQLEGDLLLSFSDEKAIASYERAAILYERHQKYRQAATQYENLLFLVPQSIEYAQKLFNLYVIIELDAKILTTGYLLIDLYQHDLQFEAGAALCNDERLDVEKRALLHEYALLAILDKKHDNKDLLVQHTKSALGYYLLLDNNNLQQFLSKLSALNNHLHELAVEHLKTL